MAKMTFLDLDKKTIHAGWDMREYLETVANELQIDEIAFFHIWMDGKEGFQLTGEELDEFVRRCVVRIVLAGGIPVRASGPGTKFKALPGYDLSPEDIAAKMLTDWASRDDEDDFGWFWFGRKEKYRKRSISERVARFLGGSQT